MKPLWKVLFKECSFYSRTFKFRFIWPSGLLLALMLTISANLSVDKHVLATRKTNICLCKKKYFPLKPLGQMSRIFVGSSYGRLSIKIAHFILIRLQNLLRSINKHGRHRQFLFLIGRFLRNLLLRNCLAK
jgi:hypothetical protein